MPYGVTPDNAKTIFDQVDHESQKHNEDNDCAVKAVAITTGVEYGRVHQTMAQHGRKPRSGTARYITTATARELGFYLVPVTASSLKKLGKTVRTFERDIAGHDDLRLLILVRGHILAVRNGRVQDWSGGRLHRIQMVWVVVPKGTRPPMSTHGSVNGLQVDLVRNRRQIEQRSLNRKPRTSATLFGHPVSAVCRALGKWLREQNILWRIDRPLACQIWLWVDRTLEPGVDRPAVSTVRTQIDAGRKGLRGDPAPLTADQLRKITSELGWG